MVRRYRDAYATRPGVTYAFLPCVMSTSGRIHGEFLRFLYILANRRTKRWFERLGYEPSDEAFKFRRGQYFWHTGAAIGHAKELAVARRTRVAEHTLRRNRAGLPPGRPPPPVYGFGGYLSSSSLLARLSALVSRSHRISESRLSQRGFKIKPMVNPAFASRIIDR